MSGQTVEKYIAPLAGGLQAVYNAATPAAPAYWRHADWLGSERLASTAQQTMYYDAAYAPFGENYAETGAGAGTKDRSFTGQTQDITLGLYDFTFRQQSSSQGRWLVPDPAGVAAVDITNPQTWNRYAYLSNGPLNAVDPKGLKCQPTQLPEDPTGKKGKQYIAWETYILGGCGGGGSYDASVGVGFFGSTWGWDPGSWGSNGNPWDGTETSGSDNPGWVGGIYNPSQPNPFYSGSFSGIWNADTFNTWQSQQFWQNPDNLSASGSLPQNQNPKGQTAALESTGYLGTTQCGPGGCPFTPAFPSPPSAPNSTQSCPAKPNLSEICYVLPPGPERTACLSKASKKGGCQTLPLL